MPETKQRIGRSLLSILAIAALELAGSSARASVPMGQLVLPLDAQLRADINIIFPGRIEAEPVREVVVEFVALGSDWATVYLNGQRVIRHGNFNRRGAVGFARGCLLPANFWHYPL
ncbi:MAG: hypothetical protein HC873_13100 [Leptolyngbyaceae cyanobacterium SL_1_1]|nr:hypothetical protein [Leptolyngbyaceae cyanobacterium SL_1_1]